MTEEIWSTVRQDKPPVSWDGNKRTFSIVLSGLKGAWVEDRVEAEWTPPLTYVVSIRAADTGVWSIAFETPLTGCGFVDLEPDTEYEVEVRSKNAVGESDPVRIKVRTGSDGSLGV